ncbi:MFS transporter [bacterium]|nr:MFS transporter [bacterium]
MTAFSNKAFLSYFISNSLALLGIWIQKIGVGWLTWQITESTFWTSFVTLALMAPAGILGPFFAVLAEKWDMRKASLLLKLLMFLIGVVIWYVQLINAHTLFTLAFLSILQGLLSACYHPVRLVFVSIVVPRALLASAIGLNSASFNASRVIGPAFAGFFIAFYDLQITFLIAMVSYIPLIPVLILMPLRSRKIDLTVATKYIDRLIEGVKVALNTPIIFKGLFIVLINAFFVRGMLEIQPTIAGEILNADSSGLSLITASAGLGALLASIWIGFSKKNIGDHIKLLVPMLITGLIISSIIGFTNNLYFMSLLFIFIGFSTTTVGIGTQTIIQLEVDDIHRARVLTWWSSISFGSLTVGGIILGGIGEFIPMKFGLIFLPVLGFIIFKLFVYFRFKHNFI